MTKKRLFLNMILVAMSTLAPTLSLAKNGLPKKTVTCSSLGFETILNSHHIRFEATMKELRSMDVSVDQTYLGNEEIFLNYIKKDCTENPESNPSSCRFDFAVYRVLPDKSVPNTSEFLNFDFQKNKITRQNMKDGKIETSEIGIPENCAFLAEEYIERENQLNKAYQDSAEKEPNSRR